MRRSFDPFPLTVTGPFCDQNLLPEWVSSEDTNSRIIEEPKIARLRNGCNAPQSSFFIGWSTSQQELLNSSIRIVRSGLPPWETTRSKGWWSAGSADEPVKKGTSRPGIRLNRPLTAHFSRAPGVLRIEANHTLISGASTSKTSVIPRPSRKPRMRPSAVACTLSFSGYDCSFVTSR